MDKQEKLEHRLSLEELYKSKMEEVMKNPKACNDKRFEVLKEKLKDYPYWAFENEDGRFVFTDKSVFFQSELADKNFERFPFFENYYFHFKKKFIDYSVVGFDNEFFMLLLFDNKQIKPLRVNGCFCGDIVVHDDTKVTDFHYTCGYAVINNRKIKLVKPFKEDINGYQLKNIKGNSYNKGLY